MGLNLAPRVTPEIRLGPVMLGDNFSIQRKDVPVRENSPEREMASQTAHRPRKRRLLCSRKEWSENT